MGRLNQIIFAALAFVVSFLANPTTSSADIFDDYQLMMVHAIGTCDADRIGVLLKSQYVFVNQPFSIKNWIRNETYLDMAVKRICEPVVSLLIQSGANVNNPTPGGAYPLWVEFTWKTFNLNIYNALMKARAQPNLERPNDLFYSAIEQNLPVINDLLAHGASLDVNLGPSDFQGNIGVMLAMHGGESSLPRADLFKLVTAKNVMFPVNNPEENGTHLRLPIDYTCNFNTGVKPIGPQSEWALAIRAQMLKLGSRPPVAYSDWPPTYCN